MSRFYTYLCENEEIEYKDEENNTVIKIEQTDFVVKTITEPEQDMKFDEMERFLPKAEGFIMLVHKGDIKKGLKRSKRLNLWRRLNGSVLQGYEKTGGGKNIFRSIQRHRSWEPENSEDFMEVMVKYGRQKEPNIVEMADPNAVDLAVQNFTIDELILKPF